MHPLPALAFALSLAIGTASAQQQSPEGGTGGATSAQPAAEPGSGEATAPATQESQGLRLDMPTAEEPGPGSGSEAPARECADAKPAPTEAGNAAADCPPAEKRQ